MEVLWVFNHYIPPFIACLKIFLYLYFTFEKYLNNFYGIMFVCAYVYVMSLRTSGDERTI